MAFIVFNVLKYYLPNFLDHKDLASLSAVNKRFRSFQSLVSADCRKNSNEALCCACNGGHQHLAVWLINVKGAHRFNLALRCACKGGHQDLAVWLINDKGAKDFDWALKGACLGGHQELAKWLINDKGANDALNCACLGGHQDLAEWLINEKGAPASIGLSGVHVAVVTRI